MSLCGSTGLQIVGAALRPSHALSAYLSQSRGASPGWEASRAFAGTSTCVARVNRRSRRTTLGTSLSGGRAGRKLRASLYQRAVSSSYRNRQGVDGPACYACSGSVEPYATYRYENGNGIATPTTIVCLLKNWLPPLSFYSPCHRHGQCPRETFNGSYSPGDSPFRDPSNVLAPAAERPGRRVERHSGPAVRKRSEYRSPLHCAKL
jgi:hypothetical protein